MSNIAVFLLVTVATIASWSDALLTSSSNTNYALRLSTTSRHFHKQSDFVLDRQPIPCSHSRSISSVSHLARCVTLNAVAEKLDTDVSMLENSQNATAAYNANEECMPEDADSPTITRPSVTVAAGNGALITSVSSDVHVKSAICNVEEETLSSIPELTVSPDTDACITSPPSDISTDDGTSPKSIDKETAVLPLPIVKHLVGRNRKKGVGAVGKVVSSIRKVAAAKTSRKVTAKSTPRKDEHTKIKATNVDWASNIQSAVADALEEDEIRQQSETFGDNPPKMLPDHGVVLLRESLSASRGVQHKITIRSSVPNSIDDTYIANLRLSVFSNFDEERQNIFRSRSVEVLNRRRRRGAIALVAEMPHTDFLQVRSRNEMNTRITSGHKYSAKLDARDESSNKIIGSVECSHHEFDRTILGNSRPKNSLLYVTEVAVCPEARRCGVGTLLMKGAEEVAALRGIESIYLHVDVNNHAAIAMYEDAGYFKLDKRRPIYAQFTCALNLHDGALMGRCHYLMCKHLTEKTTWIDGNGRY